MDQVFAFLELPKHRIEDISAKNTRKYAPLSSLMRQKLSEFYAPYNEKLDDLLGRNLNWY
jgi:hypothetical protein